MNDNAQTKDEAKSQSCPKERLERIDVDNFNLSEHDKEYFGIIDKFLSSDETGVEQVDQLYKQYIASIDEIGKTKSTHLKRTFDDYINGVQKVFTGHLPPIENKRLAHLFRKYEDNISEVTKIASRLEKDTKRTQIKFEMTQTHKHKQFPEQLDRGLSFFDESQVEGTLKYDLYYFYCMLTKYWLGQPIRKAELIMIHPCNQLLMRSILLRKFGEELDLRSANKKAFAH